MEIISGIIVAALLWLASVFIGGPIQRFFSLRGEVIRRLTEFANVRAQWKEIPDDSGAVSGHREIVSGFSKNDLERLTEAQKVFRDLASQMRAFAENENMATRILTRFWGYNPLQASAGLLGLANTYDTYGNNKAFQRKTVETALRLKS